MSTAKAPAAPSGRICEKMTNQQFSDNNLPNPTTTMYPPQGHPILYNYYPYRAFGGQNKIVYSTRFVRRAIFFNIARTLCDQSFNIDLRLRYVVRIHSSENRAMPRPP